METRTLTDDEFMRLIEEAVARVNVRQRNKWIDGKSAMQHLGISSTTTLQKLRDEGRIRYTQPFTKVILYDIDSLDAYLEKHVKEPFR